MKTTFFKIMLLCFGMAFTLSSCSLDDGDNNTVNVPNVAYGLIANASPASGDLSFYADLNKINTTPLNYTNVAGYYPFNLGERVLSVKNSRGETLTTKTVTLTGGESFSAFAVNTFNNIELVTYKDSLVYPAANHARVRFINLSPDTPSVDIKGPTQNFATNLTFKQSTEFMEVQSGSYDINFLEAGTTTSLHQSTAVQFTAGRIYTIYTKGFRAPATGSNDTFSAEQMRNY